MKRTRVGGAVAAVANKNGLGRVVKAFPPSAMLSEGERAKALEIMRKGRKAKGKATWTPGFPADVKTSPKNEEVPADRPLAFTVSVPASHEATRRFLAFVADVARDKTVPLPVRTAARDLILDAWDDV